jgi:hypothetical protein
LPSAVPRDLVKSPLFPMTMHLPFAPWSRRWRVALTHLLISVTVVAAVALVVFGSWYPPPFASPAGGTYLFAMLAGIDALLGPALTGLIAGPAKPRRELRRDIAAIAAVQCAALAYGLFSLAAARPVVLAFEVDRMRLVSAADVDVGSLALAPPAWRRLSWSGPRLLGAARPTDPSEQLKSIQTAFGGFDLAMQPGNWRDYSSLRHAAWRAARPIPLLLKRYPGQASALQHIQALNAVSLDALGFLPLQSRHATDWTVVIAAPDARVVGVLPVDSFFP